MSTAVEAAWAFVGALSEAGIRHLILSPGSRSAPAALAATRHPAMKTHVVLDERSASFYALGIAKVLREPVATLCTSGTAAAEQFPAVIEAHMARLPLVVLTADRPAELHGTGANQTIDQKQLFGNYASFLDAGPHDAPEAPRAIDAWIATARRSVELALSHPWGPVQVNLPFEEPLYPGGDAPRPAESKSSPVIAERPPEPNPSQLRDALDLIEQADRVVVLAGPMDPPVSQIVEMARQLEVPLATEALSGLRGPGALSAPQMLLGNPRFRSAHTAEVIVQFGASPTTRATQRFIEDADHLVIVDPDDLNPNPTRREATRVAGDPGRIAQALSKTAAKQAGWFNQWQEADAAARKALDGFLDSLQVPFEARVARDLAAHIPQGGLLLVGNSKPVRELEASMAPRGGLRVLANRGASGIDGLVSTAMGAGAVADATYALIGDLSLLHDLSGLAWCHSPITIVVPNDRGGGIFDLVGDVSLPEHEAIFATSHELDLGALAQACQVDYSLVEGPDITQALAAPAHGPRLVEVAIDRKQALAIRRERDLAIASALG